MPGHSGFGWCDVIVQIGFHWEASNKKNSSLIGLNGKKSSFRSGGGRGRVLLFLWSFWVHGNPFDLPVWITLGWRKLTDVVQGSICLYTPCNYFYPGAQWGVGFLCSALTYITMFYCFQEGGPGGGAQLISLRPFNIFVLCPLPQPGELYHRVGVGKPCSFASYVLSNLCSKSWILSSSLRSQTFETQKSKRSSAFWCHIPFSRQWH